MSIVIIVIIIGKTIIIIIIIIIIMSTTISMLIINHQEISFYDSSVLALQVSFNANPGLIAFWVYSSGVDIIYIYIYIYTRNAWALPRRLLEVSHSQTNANIVATLNSYGKNTWGIREYATPTTVNLEFLWEKQFGH